MAKLKDEALAHEAKARVKNIAELNSIPTDLEVQSETDAEFPYQYVIVEDEKYRVPGSVLGNLKVILVENPDLKRFKVAKTGEGMDTRYTVIPLA